MAKPNLLPAFGNNITGGEFSNTPSSVDPDEFDHLWFSRIGAVMKRGDKRYLNLLYALTISEFKLKDQSTFFGFAWSFLNPLLMLSILFLLFNMRLGKGIDHYAIYLLMGLIHYTHFSNCTNASMRILSNKLVSSTLFPKEILVIGSVLANSIGFFIAMVFCLIIAAWSGVSISWTVFALLGVLGLQVIMVVWVSLLLSCIYLFIRDFAHIYEVFLKILLSDYCCLVRCQRFNKCQGGHHHSYPH